MDNELVQKDDEPLKCVAQRLKEQRKLGVIFWKKSESTVVTISPTTSSLPWVTYFATISPQQRARTRPNTYPPKQP